MCIDLNLNIEISSFFTPGGRYDFDVLEVRLCGKLCVNFHSVAVKDTSCTIRSLTKFELPARASNTIRLNDIFTFWLTTC